MKNTSFHRLRIGECTFCAAPVDLGEDYCDGCRKPLCLACGTNTHWKHAWVCPECAQEEEPNGT